AQVPSLLSTPHPAAHRAIIGSQLPIDHDFHSELLITAMNLPSNRTLGIFTALRVILLLPAFVLSAGAQINESFSFTGLNIALPDGSLAGASDTRTLVSGVANLLSVRVKLNITGRFN